MEWHQTPGNHVFDVFDSILQIPLQSLPRARSPHYGATNLLWYILYMYTFKCCFASFKETKTGSPDAFLFTYLTII